MNTPEQMQDELYQTGSESRSYLYASNDLNKNLVIPSVVVCEFIVKGESWFVMCPVAQFFVTDINELLKDKELLKDPRYSMLQAEDRHSRFRKQELNMTDLTPDNFEVWANWAKNNNGYNLQYEVMSAVRIPYKIDAKIDLDNKHFYMRESMFNWFLNYAAIKITARMYGYTWDVVPDIEPPNTENEST